jgi:hypothetical protein
MIEQIAAPLFHELKALIQRATPQRARNYPARTTLGLAAALSGRRSTNAARIASM